MFLMFVIFMKLSKKFDQAKFYCESCGAEVAQNARFCTNCGKFFSSVRCPKCGKTGKTEDFIHGCPDCGYAVSNFGGGSLSSTPHGSKVHSKGSDSGSFFSFNSLFGHKKNGFTPSNKSLFSESSLPLWVYVVCITVLAVLVVCLYSCIKK